MHTFLVIFSKPSKETTVIHEPDNIQTEEMDVSSTEESEIDSEGESQR